MGSSFSPEEKVFSGIPQGSILGPILFTIFINDLPDCVSSYCKIFADDTKIYNVTEKNGDLQADLDRLVDWSDSWQLFFNASKCKTIHYGKDNPEYNFTMEQNGGRVAVHVGEEEKDLGVIFDRQLKFDKHIHNAVTKANQMLGIIKRSFTFLDKDMLTRLYKSLVRPHLEYANAVWCPHLKRQSNMVERVQRRATRLIKGLRGMTYEKRLRAMDLPSLKFRRLRGDLIQTYKIFNGIDKISLDTFFSSPCYTNTRNSTNKIFIKHCRTNTRKYFFSNRVAPFWNKLPTSVKTAKNINTFKNLLENAKDIGKLKFIIDW